MRIYMCACVLVCVCLCICVRAREHNPEHSLCLLQPLHTKKSSTFFGALSGQVSKSPGKFFKKPTLFHAPHLHTQGSSTIHPTSVNVGTSSVVGEGGGGEGRGVPTASRLTTRSLGFVGGASRSAGVSPGRPHPNTIGRRSPRAGAEQGWGLSGVTPVFSSASSWRERPPKLAEDPHLQDDKKSQSAPSRRKRVTFADEDRSSRVVGHPEKPTLAAAVAAVSASMGDSPRNVLTSAVLGSSLPEKRSARPMQVSKYPNDKPLSSSSSSRSNSSSSRTDRRSKQAPTLSYRMSSVRILQADIQTSKIEPAAVAPRSGTLRTLPGRDLTTLNPTLSQGRGQRTQQPVGSGYRGRGRRAHFD